MVVGAGVLAACVLFVIARTIHVARLRSAISAAVTNAPIKPNRAGGPAERADRVGKVDVVVSETATVIDVLWNLSQIDSRVIAAYDAAHGRVVPYAEIVERIQAKIHGPIVSFEGEVGRIKGYLGEQALGQAMRDSGYLVEMAPLPNQEGWDAIVDGQRIQFKSGVDAGEITSHLKRHPDIPVVTVSEHADNFAGNDMVVAIQDVSGAELHEATSTSFEAIDGLQSAGHDFPWIVAAISAGRNIQLLRSGQTDVRTAAEYVVTDVASIGGGLALGAKIGGTIGLVAGPVGVVIGAALGGAVGSMGGRVAGAYVKERRLRDADETLRTEKLGYPAEYLIALRTKLLELERLAATTRPVGMRALAWPRPSDIAGKAISLRYRAWSRRCQVALFDVETWDAKARTAPEGERALVELSDLLLSQPPEPVFSGKVAERRKRISQAARLVRSELGKLGRLK